MEFSPRQAAALRTVVTNPGCNAATVAEAIAPGSDTRGAGQTLRSLSSKGLVVRDEESKAYYPTAEGRAACASLAA